MQRLALVLVGILASAAQAEPPLPVEAAVARTAPLQVTFALSGSVEAAESLQIGFRSGGRIIALSVSVGDRVAAGAVLAEVDHAQADDAERAARAQLAASEAGLRQATQARDRVVQLLDRGAATRADVDAAEEAVLTAESTRNQAQAQVKKAEQAVRDTYLIAPAAGIVTERDAEVGQVVGAVQAVLVLATDDRREAVFDVPDVPELDDLQGTTVPIRRIGTPPALWEARVTDIAPLANEATGTVQVKAEIAPADPLPGLGEAVSGEITVPLGSTISLPASALAETQGRPAVWVIDPQTQTVALMPVQVQSYTTGTIEVSSGLAEGTLVVTEGSHLLYPGRSVVVVEGGK